MNFFMRRGGQGYPDSQDALFHSTFVVEQDGANYYFNDTTDNNRRFLITNKDFPDDWTVGFPYKSKATISAPAGDAELIAADINNYLYDSGGTPNQIPVVSLFQDVDYEHKIFTRHVAQTLDANNEELIAPRVAEMVMYNAVRTGDGLTACQSYFSVPTEVTANVKWVAKTLPDGETPASDSNLGTKESPWLTINKATTSAPSGSTVYVKTGDYQEDHTGASSGYLRIDRNITVTCIGLNTVRSFDVNRAIFIGAAITSAIKNAVIGNTVASAIGPVTTGAFAANLTFDRCWIKNGAQGINLNNAVTSITSTNNIFSGITNRLHGVGNATVTIKGCYCTDDVPIYISGASAVKNTTVQYNNFLSGYVGHAFSTNVNMSYNTLGKILVKGNPSVATANTSALLIHRNTISNPSALTVIDIDYNYYNTEISYNTMTAATTGATIDVEEQTTLVIKHNKVIGTSGKYAGITVSHSTSLQKSLTIENNRIESDADWNPIQVGTDLQPIGYAGYNSYTGIIQKNICIGTNGANASHGIVVFNDLVPIRYNYVDGYVFGAIHKVRGTDLSAVDISYNILKNCNSGISAKGGQNQPIYNNVIINAITFGFNSDVNVNDSTTYPTLNTQFKNNILVDTGALRDYHAMDYESGESLVSDTNVFYSLNNSDKFMVVGVTKTFTEWQGLGYDANSLTTNPNLDTDGIPSSPIIIGENLGASYDTGLDITTDWGSSSAVPSVVTRDQQAVGDWEVGAYVQR